MFEFSFAPLRETPLRFSFISRKGAKSIREAQRKTFWLVKRIRGDVRLPRQQHPRVIQAACDRQSTGVPSRPEQSPPQS